MKHVFRLALLAIPFLLSQCGINRQVQQAKGLSKAKYALRSADSVSLAGYDIQSFKDIKGLDDVNPLRYPNIAAGLLRKDVPFRSSLNLEIVNPTSEVAAINAFDYRLKLAGSELASGTVNKRVEVPANGGKVVVAIPVNANAYGLVANADTRNAFVDLVRNLAGSNQVSPSRVTLQIKPTLLVGNKVVKYPGYIDIDKEVTRDLLIRAAQ
jgi:hypothetical protein